MIISPSKVYYVGDEDDFPYSGRFYTLASEAKAEMKRIITYDELEKGDVKVCTIMDLLRLVNR